MKIQQSFCKKSQAHPKMYIIIPITYDTPNYSENMIKIEGSILPNFKISYEATVTT